MAPPLLHVRGLVTRFRSDGAVVHAVNGLSFTLSEGASLGIVGESGSGKSVAMMSLMGLVPDPPGRVVAGQALFRGQDLLRLSPAEMRRVRGRHVSMIFQDPMTALNPVVPIGVQITEMLRTHLRLGPRAARDRAAEMLSLVGLPRAAERLGDYPFQFSGGQRQRVMIAMALCCEPALLIADEPTTALDVTVQAQIVELIRGLQSRLGMAVVWISHNLGLVAGVVDEVVVMYAGQAVEHAPVDELFERPAHPYTRGLLAATPSLLGWEQGRLAAIEGMPPDLRRLPDACAFAPRCPHAQERCAAGVPALREVLPGQAARCVRADELLAAEAA